MSFANRHGLMRRRWLKLGGVLLWLLCFAFLAWPSLQASRRNDERIAELNGRVERMSEWLEIGPRGRGAVDLWEIQLAERFDELFPKDRQLQQLYYDLSRIANDSGIDPMTLSIMEGRHRPLPGNTGRDPEGDALMNQLGIRQRELPGSGVAPHGLRLSFESSYDELARFLDALPSLSRALNIKALDLKKGREGITASMELEYYVQTI